MTEIYTFNDRQVIPVVVPRMATDISFYVQNLRYVDGNSNTINKS